MNDDLIREVIADYRLSNEKRAVIKELLDTVAAQTKRIAGCEDVIQEQYDALNELRNRFHALRSFIAGTEGRGEHLCEDEGCPHHGTTHVCNPTSEAGR